MPSSPPLNISLPPSRVLARKDLDFSLDLQGTKGGEEFDSDWPGQHTPSHGVSVWVGKMGICAGKGG